MTRVHTRELWKTAVVVLSGTVVTLAAVVGLQWGRPVLIPIALAVLLSDDTRLPDAVMLAPSDAEPLCAGLPDLAPDATLGDLPSDRVVQALTPLRAAGEICVGTNTGTGARGGHVVIDVRVASGGAVSDACVREDETGDATLRACLVRATRALTFDDPGGAFDFELPLVLAPGISHRQRALCD